MDDLIKALQIFRKYDNPSSPFICEHDELYVNIEADAVSEEDKETLEELGFSVCEENNNFISYKYGSA